MFENLQFLCGIFIGSFQIKPFESIELTILERWNDRSLLSSLSVVEGGGAPSSGVYSLNDLRDKTS